MDFKDLRKFNAEKNDLDIGFTAGEIKSNPDMGLGDLVMGCDIFDANVSRWRTGNSIGLIGAAGNGKTSWILHNFKKILQNHPEGYCVMIALEMTDMELARKWEKVVQGDENLLNRLVIMTAYRGDTPRDLSIQGINDMLSRITSVKPERMWAFAVDHLHIIEKVAPYNELNDIVERFMRLAEVYKALGILTSQTTKTKGGMGDIPLEMTACYNCSRFEWYMTHIYTICQPLKRIQNTTFFPVTSWKLAKTRFKDAKNDPIKVGSNEIVYFDTDTESYRHLTNDEQFKFSNLYPEAAELRRLDVGGDDYSFNYKQEIINNEGKKIVLSKVVNGLKDVDED